MTLREKGETTRSQPVSPTLMRYLVAHAEERGGAGDPYGPLLRYRSGRPIGEGRYRYIWKRVGERLPWVAAQGITAHWLRHTQATGLTPSKGAPRTLRSKLPCSGSEDERFGVNSWR